MKIVISEAQLESILLKKLLNEDIENNSLFGGIEPKVISRPEDHAKRPLGNWPSDHAWDMKAPIGTPVYSITKGKVSKVYESSGKKKSIYGTQISISGIDGYPNIFYTHLDSVDLQRGNIINPGDYIGKITRWESHPDSSHVHIGIDNKKDIYNYITKSGEIKDFDPNIEHSEYSGGKLEKGTLIKQLGDLLKKHKGEATPGSSIFDKIMLLILGIIGIPLDGQAKEGGGILDKLKSFGKKNIKSKTNFTDITKIVIDEFEGGYWNGSTPENVKTTKKGICNNHPNGSMGKSTETMFGLDRYNGNIESTPEGVEFFQIIDKEKEELGIEKFCKKWKWLYRGGDKEAKLKDLAVKIIEKLFNSNMDNFVKDDETKEKILSNPSLLLHMSYATWNGPGFFQKFAKELTNAVKKGKSDSELINVAIASRAKTGLLNKGKVEVQIRKLDNA